MIQRIALVGLILGLAGCFNPRKSHIVHPVPDMWYWMQDRPTTKHGICAVLEGHADGDINSPKEGQLWAVDLPGLKRNPVNGMSIGPTPQYVFNSGSEARDWAEKNCPTGAKP